MMLEPYICTICGMYLQCFDRLKQHITRHKMKYKCARWKQRPSRIDPEKGNVQTYTRYRPYQGEFCRFSWRSHLERLITNRKKAKSNKCHQGFSQYGNLKVHVETHTKEKPYQCEYCQKACFQSSHLKVHTRTHTKEKSYQCEYCQQCFTQNGDLKRHIRTHTEKKPYQCEFCERRFTTAYELKLHIRTHTEEKPYQCEYCQKAYFQSSHLKAHIRTHTKEKTIPVWVLSESIHDTI